MPFVVGRPILTAPVLGEGPSSGLSKGSFTPGGGAEGVVCALTRGPIIVLMAISLLSPSLFTQGLGATTDPLADTLDEDDATTGDIEETSNDTEETLATNGTAGNLTEETSDLLEDDNTTGEQSPCRPGPSADTIDCDLPPTCSTVFEGTPECEPPEACQKHGADRILCVTERPGTAEGSGADTRNATSVHVRADVDGPDDVRDQLRTFAADRLSAYTSRLDELRERYQRGLDDLRETYQGAKDALREAYRVCLDDQPADVCREQALARLSVLRDRLHDQRDALRASLIAEADQGAVEVCASIDAQHRALMQTASVSPSTTSSIRASTLPALCR